MTKPRRPFKFWAMAVGMGVFTLLGLLLLLVPESEVRLTGLACILFFGVGGLGFLSGPMLTRQGAHTIRRERLETSAGSEAAFVFPTPPAKRWAMTVAAAGMAGGGVLIAILAGGGIIIAAAAIFVLFFVFMLLSASRPQFLALTPSRIVASAAAGTAELPWEAVADAELYEMPAGQTTVDMLGIAATDSDAVVWTRGAVLGRFNRRFSAGYDLVVGADTFAGEGEDVVAAIRRYRDEPDRRRAIGGEHEHARLTRDLGEVTAAP